jgi:hypothetical protein
MSNTTTELLTKTGKLTPYAFACGYIETTKHASLWREGGSYMVGGHTFADGHYLADFRTLASARKALRSVR